MGINRFNPSSFSLVGRQEQRPDGLILKDPPRAKFSQKSFGDIVEGEIVSEQSVNSRNNGNNSKQQETDKKNDATNRLAYTTAYADSVRAQVRATASEQGVARVNMVDLDQPITQKQFIALNSKLEKIGNQLNQLTSLLGSKSANTESWNLQRASLIDNLHGNSEIDIA